ncbi:MAG: desulfoferrodoxin family protein [Candidatus Hodarchaeales archaeon]|jgi:superoxide reductase
MSSKEDLFRGINKVRNPDDMTDLEKKHDISINAPDIVKAGELFEVELKVGAKLNHPNLPAHWIQYIELFIGDARINHFEMSASTISSPSVKMTIALPSWADIELVARERCNLHGIWESRKQIKIE